jgi:hypothetical protein
LVLYSFTTVTVPEFVIPVSDASPIWIFVGTSATGGYDGASAGAKFAVDYARLGASVEDWMMY